VGDLLVAPGNPGTATFADQAAIDPSDVDEVLRLAKETDRDLVVVGPEAPLVAGVGDALRGAGISVFGPDREAARIEGSKTHAKELMQAANVPTAEARSFTEASEALAYIEEVPPPYVIKADGLAAGKGVVVTDDLAVARSAIEDSLTKGRFGAAGHRVLLEEFLDGQEASLIAFTDGRRVVTCPPAQDYKRVDDGDLGPNTGGMGSYSPVPACPPELAEEIVATVLEPMVAETARRGAPFVGALYAGLALTGTGPRVIEFNARFGDPETQALIPRLRSDLGEVCLATASGDLTGVHLDWSDDRCVTLVLASGGYPGPHDTGLPIGGLDEAAAVPGVEVFHAGTARRDGDVVTAGGRVLAVTATAPTFREARARAYRASGLIDFEGKHVRTDIGRRAELSEGPS
jgi:phosphoribosylamine--glycine ligase